MVVIKGQSSMHLRQGEIGMLPMDFLGALAVGEVIHGHFDHFDPGVIDPSLTFVVHMDVANGVRD